MDGRCHWWLDRPLRGCLPLLARRKETPTAICRYGALEEGGKEMRKGAVLSCKMISHVYGASSAPEGPRTLYERHKACDKVCITTENDSYSTL